MVEQVVVEFLQVGMGVWILCGFYFFQYLWVVEDCILVEDQQVVGYDVGVFDCDCDWCGLLVVVGEVVWFQDDVFVVDYIYYV